MFKAARQFSSGIVRRNINGIPLGKTRDIGIIAHIDAGKTTTTERMLFFSGKTKRIGDVDQGNTVTDYLDSERERGITIQLAAITIPWNGHKINIIDTPGHADFTFEVIRSLRVLDGAVTILDAVEGVEAQTEKVWKQAQELKIPKIAFVNKMDREGAGFSRTVREIIQKLQTRVVVCNFPYFQDSKLRGVVDVINKKLLVWDLDSDANGKKISVEDLDDHLHEMVAKSRESMVETLCEFDEDIVDSFLENDEDCMKIPSNLINKAIRNACISNDVTPVFCGSGFKNIGVQPLMDAVVSYLPSPLEAPIPELTSNKRVSKKVKTLQSVEVAAAVNPGKGLVINNDPNLTVALAFKVITDKIRGVMTFLRVYSGKLTNNTTFINTRTGKKYTVRNLLLMHGDEPESVQFIPLGNIGVIAGNEEITTGDTLVAHSGKNFSDVESHLKLMPIEIPPPLFNSSIEPLTAGDERHMRQCIEQLVREDPSIHVFEDSDLGQTIISGMGELHLEIIRERLVNDLKAKVKLRDIAVSYKETLSRPSYKSVQISDEDAGIHMEVQLDAFDGEAANSEAIQEEGAELTDQDNNIIVFETIPQYMIDAVNENRWKADFTLDDLQDAISRGAQVALQIGGPVAGFSLHSMVVRVKNWDFPIDNKTPPVKLADITRRAVLKAIEEEAQFTVLEPIMQTKVFVTSDKLGDVTHDLTQRCGGQITSIEDEGTDDVELISWAIDESKRVFLPPDYTLNASKDTEIKNKKVIVAETPLREMVGYLSKLRSMTQGRATFDMSYRGMRRTNSSRMDVFRQ